MAAEQIAGLGLAYTSFLDSFKTCFVTRKTFGHLNTYCRGLLSDSARKSVEPIALAAGCAVRTLQEFGHLNRRLVRWAQKKYKRIRARQRRATQALRQFARQRPELFAHWQIGVVP